jgi:hypothetical protein
MIHSRRELPEVGQGRLVLLDSGNPAVFAHACERQGRGIAAFHNLSSEPCAVDLNGLDRELRDESLPADQDYGELDPASLALGPYGYRWLRFAG